MPKREMRLYEVAFRRVGFRQAVYALTFVCAWGVVVDQLGREPTMEEYWTWWGSSRATAYRERTAWQAAFPELDVTEFWLQCREDLRARGRDRVKEGAFEVGFLPFPVEVAF